MAPKSYVLFVAVFFCALYTTFSNQCDNFYAKITYGLSHSKKALTATNFEHQMYYAERALIALEKSKVFIAECDCAKSEDKTLDAIETLNKAIEPIDWDAGRFYTKKSVGIINELITILDECTLGNAATAVVEDGAESTLEHEAYAEAEENNKASMEMEMIKVFEKHSSERLQSAEKAIEQLVLFSNSFNHETSESGENPNSLEHHQKAYLEKAQQLLEEGLQSLQKNK